MKVSFLNDFFPDGLSLTNCNFGECALSSTNPSIVSVVVGPEDLTLAEKIIIGAAVLIIILALIGIVA